MVDEKAAARPSPFMPMFETFRAELDEHHARRERIIKASRDITAASKKMFVPGASSKQSTTDSTLASSPYSAFAWSRNHCPTMLSRTTSHYTTSYQHSLPQYLQISKD
jgi:hypothetical protein